MKLALFERKVAEWAHNHAEELGLLRKVVTAEYIWNPGGFVNQSYKITDGKRWRHIKLARKENVPALKQWMQVNSLLMSDFKAPTLICEIKEELVPGYPYGLVFEYFEGKPLSGNDQVTESVLHKLQQLHSSSKMKEHLTRMEPITYADAFTKEYITRFQADLSIIESEKDLLSFVDEETLHFFHQEVDDLQERVCEDEAFRGLASDVVHNDMNWHNVLVDDAGGYRIIDWDDLTSSGDAAMDYSVFLWPFYQTAGWDFWREKVEGLAGEEILDRMHYYFKAKLLDEVIDVLADYIEAEELPEIKNFTQEKAMMTHLEALTKYKALYNGK
ncbi:aminoglycoside phosphotransferase family protein [Halobacillus litoralis]|uniref:Aminoglycoside phosphotransferase family protein n=1 Tax=Halobacillus litoralis TaxID=45668 RepID=A0A410M9M9_9BACI|nr:aminoglycoside phosphotransferase family protein [Halobacillus litoralis]QAS51397.1 aminoglycoside phosphotransferase family protein [Halobacillus litoralis]